MDHIIHSGPRVSPWIAFMISVSFFQLDRGHRRNSNHFLCRISLSGRKFSPPYQSAAFRELNPKQTLRSNPIWTINAPPMSRPHPEITIGASRKQHSKPGIVVFAGIAGFFSSLMMILLLAFPQIIGGRTRTAGLGRQHVHRQPRLSVLDHRFDHSTGRAPSGRMVSTILTWG